MSKDGRSKDDAGGGFAVRKTREGFAVSRDGAVLSLHPTRDEAAAMAAALGRRAGPGATRAASRR